MKIYITGILGLLGYNIVKVLENRCQITGIDTLDLDVPNLHYMVGSLFDKEKVEEHIKAERPDVLVHTAALVNVDKCEEEPQNAVMLNVDVTKYLAQICNKYNVKMIYISTDAVFDGESTELYTENDVTNPLNVYGKTKLEGERYVMKYPNNLVLRTNIYGKNIQNKRSFGEWIYYELCNGNELNMFSDIDFSPILVNELAEIIYEASKKKLVGLYHACSTGCITKYEFGMKLKEISGISNGKIVETSSDSMKFFAKRSKHMGMSNDKLCRELGIHISTPEEGIRKFCEMMECDDNGN